MTIYAITPPPSVNSLHPTGRPFRNKRGKMVQRRFRSSEYKAWLTEAGWQLKSQKARPIKGRVAVYLHVPENGRRDLDGHAKATLDLLVTQGIIEGDRCKTLRQLTMYWHNEPAMIVEILRIPNGAD